MPAKKYASQPTDIEWQYNGDQRKCILRGVSKKDLKLLKLIQSIVASNRDPKEIEKRLARYVAQVKVYAPEPSLICIKVLQLRIAKSIDVNAQDSTLNQMITKAVRMVGTADSEREQRLEAVSQIMEHQGIPVYQCFEEFKEVRAGEYALKVFVKHNGPPKDKFIVNPESPISSKELLSLTPGISSSPQRMRMVIIKKLREDGYLQAEMRLLGSELNAAKNTIEHKIEINAGPQYILKEMDCLVDERLPESIRPDVREILDQFRTSVPLRNDFSEVVLKAIMEYLHERNLTSVAEVQRIFTPGEKTKNGSTEGVLSFCIRMNEDSPKVRLAVNENMIDGDMGLEITADELKITTGDLVSKFYLDGLDHKGAAIVLEDGKLLFNAQKSTFDEPNYGFGNTIYYRIPDVSGNITRAEVNLRNLAGWLGLGIEEIFMGAPTDLDQGIVSIRREVTPRRNVNVAYGLHGEASWLLDPVALLVQKDLIKGTGPSWLPMKLLNDFVVEPTKEGSKISPMNYLRQIFFPSSQESTEVSNVMVGSLGAKVSANCSETYKGWNYNHHAMAGIFHKVYRDKARSRMQDAIATVKTDAETSPYHKNSISYCGAAEVGISKEATQLAARLKMLGGCKGRFNLGLLSVELHGTMAAMLGNGPFNYWKAADLSRCQYDVFSDSRGGRHGLSCGVKIGYKDFALEIGYSNGVTTISTMNFWRGLYLGLYVMNGGALFRPFEPTSLTMVI